MIAIHRPSRWPAPLRAVADRLSLGVLVAVSVGLMVLAKADLRLLDVMSSRAGDLMAPVLDVLGRPAALLRSAGEAFGGILALEAENRRLRAQLEQLRAQAFESTRLEVQNEALRRALAMPPRDDAPLVTTARIVGDSGGPFVRTRLIDAGADRGVPKGAVALVPEGMVGRVVQTGERSARVLLLTDLNSRIPARIERTGERAVLAGDNSQEPILRFLPQAARARPGDRVVTSGEDGAIPAGLPLGVVAETAGGEPRVRLFVDDALLDVVRIVDYRPPRPPEAFAAESGR